MNFRISELAFSSLARKRLVVEAARPLCAPAPIYLDDPVHPLRLEHDGRCRSGPFALELWESDRIGVSGSRLLWRGDEVLVEPLFMANYWRRNLTGTKWSTPERDARLPIRKVGSPVISALGWAADSVYGHFFLEMLPKLMWADAVLKADGVRARILLTTRFPVSQIDALIGAGFKRSDFEFFDPDAERVKLECGYYPTHATLGGFHPAIAPIFESRFGAPSQARGSGVAYLSRSKIAFHPGRRNCRNETELEAIAVRDFGAEIVHPQEIPWAEQLRMFQTCAVVAGLSGSALHNAILADKTLRVGVIGHINNAQTHIAGLRSQRNAYQVKPQISGDYTVPVDGFRALMTALIRA